jgi:hypothetical protein
VGAFFINKNTTKMGYNNYPNNFLAWNDAVEASD